MYYFLKNERTDKQELCSVLEELLRVDPTSELSEEYTKLRMHQTGKLRTVPCNTAVQYFCEVNDMEQKQILAGAIGIQKQNWG